MRKDLERGSSFDGFVILIGLLIVLFFFILPDNGPGTEGNVFTLSGGSSAAERSTSRNTDGPEATSAYSRSITISKGNAEREYRPHKEYVTISNRSDALINITGWLLKDGDDESLIEVRGEDRRPLSEVAVIPRGAAYISPTGASVMQNIILRRGEKAIITTGNPGSRTPYRMTSFKENICSGYLDDSSPSHFEPPLRKSCPDPEHEPGIERLDDECRDFIGNMRSCTILDIGEHDDDGDFCQNCVDGVRLSNACIAFLEGHYNYEGCLANHRNTENFHGDTWRVFLDRQWEMWGEDYESISLIDQFGRLVDYISY